MEDCHTEQGPSRQMIYRPDVHNFPRPSCSAAAPAGGMLLALGVQGQAKLPALPESDEVTDDPRSTQTCDLSLMMPTVSDSVSSMPASRRGGELAKMFGQRQQLPTHRDAGSGQTGAPYSGPRMQRWVCSMYRLPPYISCDHCSASCLGIANSIMQTSTLPGLALGSFHSVSGNSLLYYLGVSWGFTAMTIALGSSYFQRLCHKVPSLEWAAQRHSNFSAYAAPRMFDFDANMEACYSASSVYKSRERTLMGCLFTCVSIASKNVDRVGHPGILRYMLGKIYGTPVSADHAYDVENKCLDGLNWQLGPYYVDDRLDDTWVAWIPE